jgi:hypothetical protein
MTLRERNHDGRDTLPGSPVPAGRLDLRAAAERLLAQGADAIERALSQDSAAFLAANRQEGGQ